MNRSRDEQEKIDKEIEEILTEKLKEFDQQVLEAVIKPPEGEDPDEVVRDGLTVGQLRTIERKVMDMWVSFIDLDAYENEEYPFIHILHDVLLITMLSIGWMELEDFESVDEATVDYCNKILDLKGPDPEDDEEDAA